MISALQCSTSAKDTSHLDLVSRHPKVDSNLRHLAHSPDPSLITARNPLTKLSNTVHRPPTTPSVNGTSVDDMFFLLSRSYPPIQDSRVATQADYHDTDAWTQERKMHDTKLNAVAASSSLGSNGTIPSDFTPVDVDWSSSAAMDLRTQSPRNIKQCSSAQRENTISRARGWNILGIPVLVSPIGPCSCEDLSEGRRRVGEILVRCGVINVSRMSPAVGCWDTSPSRPVDPPATSNVAAEVHPNGNDQVLITALAEWTSEWLHTLVIQPYLRGSFRFQYQGKPSGTSASVVSRIRRVLNNVHNPVQVAIHALWFIGTLTGNGPHDNAPFLSVPIFRYLHNNGTFVAEDLMFRIFVICAMIGDKSINDATLSTNAWNCLTHVPQAILNAAEKYALSCLKWNVMMTQAQWQDTITYLRSCIKMGSVFDPFAYDEDSPSGIMARYLDELVNLSYPEQAVPLVVEILAPQPIRHFTHWEVFSTAEWCPEDDPIINQKPRTIGIAPGADQCFSTPRVGTTAKDLLDSILGSSNVPGLTHLTRSAGTLFCGSFGGF